jgi:N-acetyl-gamma-glutamyl-phosphate reductase
MVESDKIKVGIVGAKALTAGVLIDLCLAHKNISLVSLSGRDEEPQSVAKFFPSLRGRLNDQPCGDQIVPFNVAEIASKAEAVFLCLPHKTASGITRELVDAGCRVIDLSADFRFQQLDVYERVYQVQHGAPELNDEAPYALVEHESHVIPRAKVVGVPGCYPTSILLALLPLVRAGLIDASRPIVSDSKTGVSGAGRNPTDATHYCNANESLAAYGNIGGHRHRPEIEEKLKIAGQDQEFQVMFTPHLAPMERGIYSSVYAYPTNDDVNPAAVRACWEEAYSKWPLVRVLEDNAKPSIQAVARTGFCDLGAFQDSGTGMLVLFSALDNLMKGASSQALQAFNLMYSFPDARGILQGY